MHHDAIRNIVSFSFVDLGVGILASARLRALVQTFKILGISTSHSILTTVLNGEVESRTQVPYRGKGLPKLAKSRDRGQVERLVILANRAYVERGVDDRCRDLKKAFPGTLVYWEIHGNPHD